MRAIHSESAQPGPAFARTHHVLWLEFGNREDFDDPHKEWRRLFSELGAVSGAHLNPAVSLAFASPSRFSRLP